MSDTGLGTPALKMRGKLILRVNDADTLVLMRALELLMKAAQQI
jgi:hypothetical protein